MRTLFPVFFVLFSTLIIIGCSGSRALSNRALELEKAGLTREASDFYYMALQRDPRNVDARIGLRQTGKEVLDKELDEFFKANAAGDHKQAVYSYKDAEQFMEKCNIFVNLTIPSYHKELYEESLNTYLTERYYEAEELMYKEKYDEADAIYKEIVKLNPDFKDAQELLKLSKVEPMYQKGVRAYEDRNYREAYILMKRIIDKKGTYKDAIDYRDRALDRAIQTVALTEIKTNSQAEKELAGQLKNNILSSVVSNDNPFIKVIDRRNTERIMDEQRINMTMSSGRDSRVRAGEMLGADLLIIGEILSFTVDEGEIESYDKPAYREVRVRKRNPRTGERYYASSTERTSYKEYYGEKVMTCKVQFQLVDAHTGEVATSEVFEERVIDRLNFATYRGDLNNLTPAPESMDSFTDALKFSFSRSAQQEFKQKFSNNRRKYASDNDLKNNLAERISNKMVKSLNLNNPDI